MKCDGSADCPAIEHVEGCYATMYRRRDVPRLPLIGQNHRLRSQLRGAVSARDELRDGLAMAATALEHAGYRDSAASARATITRHFGGQ